MYMVYQYLPIFVASKNTNKIVKFKKASNRSRGYFWKRNLRKYLIRVRMHFTSQDQVNFVPSNGIFNFLSSISMQRRVCIYPCLGVLLSRNKISYISSKLAPNLS